MSKMISVASGFQYSVNIGFDLNNDDKLKNFIPTKSALTLLEEILISTNVNSTNRARVLIGAYGKGKSHIVLMILSMLMKKDINLFTKLLPFLQENPRLNQCVQNYYDSDNKILPVVITGSNTSLPQAFLLALQRTLAENDMLDIMPETNYKAAVAVINRWKTEFPATYSQLQNAISEPVTVFLDKLIDFDTTAYEQFERIYPSLTAGSAFNPFLGFDVTDLYENAVRGLRTKGYTGIYVIYDEFSKFLEANISEASMSDTKMLQDFAEKCNRSGANQLHLMLISHKEISNYIDILPKQKVDGWRGVSERFSHIHISNNFSQTYDIIASVIQKDPALWQQFCFEHAADFDELRHGFISHPIFSDIAEEERSKYLHSCYPLHPASTFILPRLSERVAQNERTLFTFLSAEGTSTLPNFLNNYADISFEVITPDVIYDYFEPLFRKDVTSGALHDTYILTQTILNKLEPQTLETKIVKTLSLIYILEQFEKIKPTKGEIVSIFSINHTPDEINQAIQNLIEEEYVIYLKRSNSYLRLKETSGVDVRQQISNAVATHGERCSVKDVLNAANFDSFIYPSRYNDSREMTRFFSFEFIEEDEVASDVNWSIKSEKSEADGVIYGIIPKSEESIARLQSVLLQTSQNERRFVFILPKRFREIQNVVREFSAVTTLRNASINDKVLFDEYEVIYEDLREVIGSFINAYTHPEEYKSTYIHAGSQQTINRKAALTELLSQICDDVYALTPVINIEAINQNNITSIAKNSRAKVIAALLRNELEPSLGLSGSGQEVSIMRSTLVKTGVLCDSNGIADINLAPEDKLMHHLMDEIIAFILDARAAGKLCFSKLYERLCSPDGHIGLRRGLIPIYLAAVFHKYKRELIIEDKNTQIPLNADALLQINATPESFYLAYLEWDPEKEALVQQLEELFSDKVIKAEKNANSYDYVVSAMRRWYMGLPKYTKGLKKTIGGKRVDNRYVKFLNLLKQPLGSHEILFTELPNAFGYANQVTAGLAENIDAAKRFFDDCIICAKEELAVIVKTVFAPEQNRPRLSQMSLSSVVHDWCDTLDPQVFEQLFSDGTDTCLGLFQAATADGDLLIARLAKATTGLRLEDWDDSTLKVFEAALKQCRQTAESYHPESSDQIEGTADGYQISYLGKDGKAVTKRFEHTEISSRAKLLLNTIVDEIDSMGRSISEQEKRQVLMEVLKNML